MSRTNSLYRREIIKDDINRLLKKSSCGRVLANKRDFQTCLRGGRRVETSEAGGMGRGEKTGESRRPLRIVSDTP